MRIKELVLEDVPFQPAPATGGVAPGQTPGKEGQDIGKLTATIADMQKKIANLQQAALQKSATLNQPQQPVPGEASQVQQPKGTVGTGTGNGTLQQQSQQAQQPVAGQKPAVGQPMGQQPAPGAPTIKPVQKPVQAPGVTQPPQITDLKIKQDLARSQAGGK